MLSWGVVTHVLAEWGRDGRRGLLIELIELIDATYGEDKAHEYKLTAPG
jgi:hypothetical protein